jgi:hypothetical protein
MRLVGSGLSTESNFPEIPPGDRETTWKGGPMRVAVLGNVSDLFEYAYTILVY